MLKAARQLDRLDRHVDRSFVHIHGEASRFRVEFSLEEALRFADLPGEREGRIYCFRTVSFSVLSAEAPRSAWMARVQTTLGTLAAEAVHASVPHASSRNAVYFHSQEDAQETALQLALTGQPTPWFVASAVQVDPQSTPQAMVFAVVEHLLEAMPFAAAADLIVTTLEEIPSAAVSLLQSIPESAARSWLRQLDNRPNSHPQAAAARLNSEPAALSTPRASFLVNAARHFGWQDPRTHWFAALLMVAEKASLALHSSVVERARDTVRDLEAQHVPSPSRFLNVGAAAPKPARLFFADEAPEPAPPTILPRSVTGTPHASPKPAAALAKPDRPSRTLTPPLLGEPTACAGLFFLLQPLRRLGIAAALRAVPLLADADFAFHLLRALAGRAFVASADPMLLALNSTPSVPSDFILPTETLASVPPAAWPQNLRPAATRPCTSHDLLRAWTLAVQRWCWHHAGLTLHQIVHRPGTVWSSRTDLDVTLPLDHADLRIRRAGLDLDPGWLPWLGPHGRVVRFHYHQGEWPPTIPNPSEEVH
jgi:uncharacterized membrane protein YebE (DUF533 family)